MDPILIEVLIFTINKVIYCCLISLFEMRIAPESFVNLIRSNELDFHEDQSWRAFELELALVENCRICAAKTRLEISTLSIDADLNEYRQE